MKSAIKKTCKNCGYFNKTGIRFHIDDNGNMVEHGECRRHSPSMSIKTGFDFPCIPEDEWCGDWDYSAEVD